MMKIIKDIKYECDICGEKYNTKKEALSCESKTVSKDKGVKIGDVVLITDGEGAGIKAKVTKKCINSKYWGHYAWERYWHTVSLEADVIDGYGMRFLTYDQYEKITG